MNEIVFSQEQLEQVYDLYYNQNLSLENVGKHFNTSGTKIRNLLIKNGKEIQPKKHRKYKINDNYFDVIDTPNKAYIIGLLAADGCNYKDDGLITLSLQERDKDILEKISKEMDSDRPLSVRHFKYDKWQDSYTLKFYSHKLTQRLIEIGIIPNKSLTLDFPKDIPNELIPCMLRGYIDGDGWVQPHVIGLMSTEKFCEGAKKYLNDYLGIDCKIQDMKRNYNIHTKTLYVNDIKNLIPLSYTLYEQGDLYIERKKDSFIRYGFLYM